MLEATLDASTNIIACFFVSIVFVINLSVFNVLSDSTVISSEYRQIDNTSL
jgi:hypothetical protein